MTQGPGVTPLAIECRGISKSFRNRLVLKNIDLQVRHGESVVIFGPNGAGKTTLINILATISRPSSGKVLIDGLSLDKEPETIRQKIGIVSHQTMLYGNLTAHENLDFYCRLYGIPERRERIREVTEKVGMTSRLHDRVGTLSRGMQQRISIARCLLHKPSIIFLDEPETGLDVQASSLLWEALELNGQASRTVIHTTHSLERGFELCNRLIILAKGRIVFESSRESLNVDKLKQTFRELTGVGL